MQIKREYSNNSLKHDDVIYPELSYDIIGAAFDTYNELGWGHDEKIYQRAFAIALEKRGITYEKEKLVYIEFSGKKIAKKFLDFFIDGKLVVELKIAPRMGYVHINQVLSYLKSTKARLAILIYFLQDGVRYRRIINYIN